MTKQTIYWGVLCRECSVPVAFGSPSHHQFELGSAYARPGTIQCANGHRAIYFPRDFTFFSSDEEISDDAMRTNREAHRANNPVIVAPSDQRYGTRWTPPKQVEPVYRGVSKESQLELAEASRDPRRAEAQAEAKDWWTRWAAKKVS